MLLGEWSSSGESMSTWCAARGINVYSLSAHRGWQRDRAEFVEVVTAVAVPPRPAERSARYRVLVGDHVVEVDDRFNADTLRRLLDVVASC